MTSNIYESLLGNIGDKKENKKPVIKIDSLVPDKKDFNNSENNEHKPVIVTEIVKDAKEDKKTIAKEEKPKKEIKTSSPNTAENSVNRMADESKAEHDNNKVNGGANNNKESKNEAPENKSNNIVKDGVNKKSDTKQQVDATNNAAADKEVVSKNSDEPAVEEDNILTNDAERIKYNNQRLSESEKSQFSRSHSASELEDYARKQLKEISYSDNVFEGTSSVISQSLFGFRAFFIGDKSGTKKDFINDFGRLLYDIGKISSPEPERLNFIEIPDYFNADRLYVITNISDAVITLFGADDFSGEASMDQVRYKKKLEKLIQSPGSAYIILDAEDTEIRGFKTLDPRVQYVFEKNIVFPNLSDKDIYKFFKEYIPEDFAEKEKLNNDFEEYFVGYMERNRRYFPFNNKELSMYLANYAAGQNKLILPPEKYDATTVDEAFSKIVGLEVVKRQVKEMQEYLQTRRKLEGLGIKLPEFNMHMLLIGSPGTGKSVPGESKVIRRNFINNSYSWAPIKDLKVGDIVMGGTGEPCKVLGVYPQPIKDFYEITFSDGIKQECCAEHLWRVQDRYGRRNTKRDKKLKKQVPKEQTYQVLKTADMANDFRIISDSEDRCKYSIDYVTPIEFPEKNLPIDPYALGALLGDGSICDAALSITSIDSDIIDKVERGLKKDFPDCIMSKQKNGKTYNIIKSGEIKAELWILHLLDKHAEDKFIPEEYLFASVEQRWELLRGLLDTDGSADTRGGYIEYTSVSERLTKDVQQLVLSLGGQARLGVKEEPFYKDENGEKVICQKAYRLIIMFCKEDGDKAFYLKRKKDIYKPQRLRKNIKRYIEDIRPVEPQEGVCIEVDDPTHTYVIQNYIITHNTTVARIIAKVLFDLGYIKEDKLIEVTSKDLVAPTGGMTGAKTNKVIMNSMGGVLFVDEAYSLAISSGTPGLEAIANLVNLI